MIEVKHNADMSRRNTFGMRVAAACLVEYDSIEDLPEICGKLRSGEFPSPVLHIGTGSNLLFTKDLFPGTLLHSNIKYITALSPAPDETAAKTAAASTANEGANQAAGQDAVVSTGKDAATPSAASDAASDAASPSADEADSWVEVEVGAGVIFDDFCRWACEQGLWGVENLSGIPGETGAAAVQNIGAYGVEAKDAILRVNCYDVNLDRLVSFKADDCGYGYRDSLFKRDRKGRYIVTSVIFRLTRYARPMLGYGHLRAAVEEALGDARLTPQLVREVILRTRDSKLPDPTKIGSAGSFFKNPVVPKSAYDKAASIATLEGPDTKVPFYNMGSGFVKIPAAWLIEHCGWKGYREGNAGVYEKQPLVLINATGEATAAEILDLEARIVASVKEKFDITLTPEVEHV